LISITPQDFSDLTLSDNLLYILLYNLTYPNESSFYHNNPNLMVQVIDYILIYVNSSSIEDDENDEWIRGRDEDLRSSFTVID
jgi:hypothetical protein